MKTNRSLLAVALVLLISTLAAAAHLTVGTFDVPIVQGRAGR